MREGKDSSEWDKAATLCLVVTSMVSDKVSIYDFHPYMTKPRRLDAKTFGDLKRAMGAGTYTPKHIREKINGDNGTRTG